MSRYELAVLLLAAAIPVIVAWRGERKRLAAVLAAIRDRCGSRVKAADRLRGIIAADRASAPCGRWVKVSMDPMLRLFWWQALSNAGPVLRRYIQRELKPRYRLEMRR